MLIQNIVNRNKAAFRSSIQEDTLDQRFPNYRSLNDWPGLKNILTLFAVKL